MRKKIVAVILLLGVGCGVSYKLWDKPAVVNRSADSVDSSGGASASSASLAAAQSNSSVVAGQPLSVASSVAYDPRLANLAVSVDNPMIEYMKGEGGVVVAEIDNDPNNISYKKPLREYQYQKGRVRTLTRYEYYKTEIVITTIDAAYKENGSLLDYRENTVTRKFSQ